MVKKRERKSLTNRAFCFLSELDSSSHGKVRFRSKIRVRSKVRVRGKVRGKVRGRVKG